MSISFDPEEFSRLNREAKESKGFSDIDNGTYIASLERAEIKPSKAEDSKSVQVSFGWQIDAEDESFANQWVWTNQTLKNRSGEMNEIGIKWLCSTLYTLSEGQFHDEEFLNDPNGCLDRFVGTIARIKVKQKPDDYGMKYQVYIQKVLQKKYASALDNGNDEDVAF